jgi:hypothetical protein
VTPDADSALSAQATPGYRDALAAEFERAGIEPPNLFVVGAPKAGTHTLWYGLSEHPDVFMTQPKEPNYFRGSAWPGGITDPKEYVQLFAGASGVRYRGEASVSYLASRTAADWIRSSLGQVRVIVSLRDPVERAYSGYWWSVRKNDETRSFPTLVEDELAERAVHPTPGKRQQILRGYYAEQIERYFDAFGDSLLVLFFEELVADVRGTMRDVYEWLGLDPAPAASFDDAPRAPFRLVRHPSLAALALLPGVKPLQRLVLRGRLRSWIERRLLIDEKPPLDPELRARLRDVYAPHDERLRRLLRRPLPWDGRG